MQAKDQFRNMRDQSDLQDAELHGAPRRLKILLVEDNETDVWLFCEAFEALRLDHDIQVVRDGEAALEILTDPEPAGGLPEMILLEINLPKVDGFTVLTTLRADPRWRSIPVIMLSSSRNQ